MPLLWEDDEGLLPPYTLGERSRELRQRSKMLCWRARYLRARSTKLLHKHCPFRLYLYPSSPTALSPPRRGVGDVDWVYVGETLRCGAGAHAQ
jgi:hypothetical protein